MIHDTVLGGCIILLIFNIPVKAAILKAIILFSPLISFAQESPDANSIKRNSVYVEAFGQGIYNSFCFDRLYHTDRNIMTSLSVGFTAIPSRELFVAAVPVSYNFLFGQKNNHLELGMGFTAMYLREGRMNVTESTTDDHGVRRERSFTGSTDNFYSYFTPKIGYRYQKNGGGIFFRFTFTPAVAGINSIGGINGSEYTVNGRGIEYFSSAAFFGYRVFPWAGASIGWTLR